MNLSGILDPNTSVPGTPAEKWGYRDDVKAGYLIMSDEEYLDFPAVSASLVKCATLSEMHTLLTTPQKDSEALKLGTLTDMAILTPEKDPLERFAAYEIPVNPKTGKPFGAESQKAEEAYEMAVAEHPGKHVVTVDEYRELSEEMTELRAAFWRYTVGVALIQNAALQLVGIMWHPVWKCWVKWKPDVLPLKPEEGRGHRWAMRDLKTTRHHPAQFKKDVYAYGYHYQAVWYKHCHEECLGLLGLTVCVTLWDWLVVSKPDTDGRKPRRAMARAFRIDLSPGACRALEPVNTALFPADGMGRVEKFTAALRQHLNAGADPDVNTIWPGYENDEEPALLDL